MVNDPIALPVAVYAKPASSADAGGYRFLVRHPAFDPPAIDRALRRLVTALEWKPAPAPHQSAPVFGILVEGDVTIVARFLDVGRDANGRPQSLRVECVLWDGGAPPRALLRDRLWTGSIEKTGVMRILRNHALAEGGLPFPIETGKLLLIGNPAHFSHAGALVLSEITAGPSREKPPVC